MACNDMRKYIKGSSGERERDAGGKPADNLTSDNDQASKGGWRERMHFLTGMQI
jgi:hypothetical protein